jgi:hypothetical protein
MTQCNEHLQWRCVDRQTYYGTHFDTQQLPQWDVSYVLLCLFIFMSVRYFNFSGWKMQQQRGERMWNSQRKKEKKKINSAKCKFVMLLTANRGIWKTKVVELVLCWKWTEVTLSRGVYHHQLHHSKHHHLLHPCQNCNTVTNAVTHDSALMIWPTPSCFKLQNESMWGEGYYCLHFCICAN